MEKERKPRQNRASTPPRGARSSRFQRGSKLSSLQISIAQAPSAGSVVNDGSALAADAVAPTVEAVRVRWQHDEVLVRDVTTVEGRGRRWIQTVGYEASQFDGGGGGGGTVGWGGGGGGGAVVVGGGWSS